MKTVNMIKFSIISLLLIGTVGCGTETSNNTTSSAKINRDTVNLNGNELIDLCC